MRSWTQIKKAEHGTADWLAQRWALPSGEKLVGASQVAAIFGAHPYTTPEELAAELLAPRPPEPSPMTDVMERGVWLEPVLIERANIMLGRFFETPSELFVYCEDNARMVATLDGFDGSEVLEVKTTTRDWTGELPSHWYHQGVQQAICANVDHVNWCVFDRSQTVKLHRQYVSSDEKAEHIKAVGEWLSYIDMGVPPEGVSWTRDTVETRYPDVAREVTELGPRGHDLVFELVALKRDEKALTEKRSRIEGDLCDLLGDAGTGTVNGEVVVTWKSQTRKSLDQKALKEAHPDLVEQYTKESSYRVLRTKGNQ